MRTDLISPLIKDRGVESQPGAVTWASIQNKTAFNISSAMRDGKYRRYRRGGSEVTWLWRCSNFGTDAAMTRREYWKGGPQKCQISKADNPSARAGRQRKHLA